METLPLTDLAFLQQLEMSSNGAIFDYVSQPPMFTLPTREERDASLSPNIHCVGNDSPPTSHNIVARQHVLAPPVDASHAHPAPIMRRRRGPKATTLKDKDWARVKPELMRLYPDNGLGYVMKELRDKFGFVAT